MTMNAILFLLCIPILYFYPILYSPVACFTSILFTQNKNLGYESLFLIFSSAIISSLIAATIIPTSDTLVYVESFRNALYSFDITKIQLNDSFEPLYQIYEYCIGIFIGDNEKLFLLITALIFNIFSTIAILRICIRLNETRLVGIIFVLYHSLVTPALGMPLFLLRSSLSLSILILGISFYKQKTILCYLLGIVSFFIHYSSGTILIITIIIFVFNYLIQNKINIFNKFFDLSNCKKDRVFIMILIAAILSVTFMPQVINSVLGNYIGFFSDSGTIGSNKASYFTQQADIEMFIQINNPLVIINILLTFLCFLKLRKDVFLKLLQTDEERKKIYNLLEILRFFGKILMIVMVFTLPFGLLPYRLCFFNFLYFPLWLINIPFISMPIISKNYSRYFLIFSLISVLVFIFYRIPKIQDGNDSSASTMNVVVLNGEPLNYNLNQVIEYFL
jgi:hypothetical protein